MHIFAMLGSRNPEGRTAQATDALLKGAQSNGTTAEKVFLPAVQLERCRQCDEHGWGLCRSEGRCVIQDDDFAELTSKLRGADLVVLATPVYFSDLSESMKCYLDRLRRVTRHENGRKGVEGKPVVGIAMAGGGGGGAPACIRNMEKTLQNCGMDVLDMVLVRRQNLDLKCEVLEVTGKWLAAQRPES